MFLLAGEKLFVEYAGQTVPLIGQHSGEVRQVQVFVAVLGASSYTFAEAMRSNLRRAASASLDRML